jgi:hypothetical protein
MLDVEGVCGAESAEVVSCHRQTREHNSPRFPMLQAEWQQEL